ncbi:MAG: 50S ribosomal protein L30 [Candidatus Micrarchaeota archaeon]|nr:50S ribosomal protein L30 [Candidatus Micrarchaeota archaeon]
MLAVIRIRGNTGIRGSMKDTMRMLRLTRVNHCTLFEATAQNLGMIKKCKDYVTWGEVDKATLSKLLEKRGRIGQRKLDGKDLEELKIKSFDELADAVLSGSLLLKNSKIKQVFRLHPPRKGHKSTKEYFPRGSLGNRREKINEIIGRMV